MQCMNIVGRQHIYAHVASDMLNCIILFPDTVSFTFKKYFLFWQFQVKRVLLNWWVWLKLWYLMERKAQNWRMF